MAIVLQNKGSSSPGSCLYQVPKEDAREGFQNKAITLCYFPSTFTTSTSRDLLYVHRNHQWIFSSLKLSELPLDIKF